MFFNSYISVLMRAISCTLCCKRPFNDTLTQTRLITSSTNHLIYLKVTWNGNSAAKALYWIFLIVIYKKELYNLVPASPFFFPFIRSSKKSRTLRFRLMTSVVNWPTHWFSWCRENWAPALDPRSGQCLGQ